MSPAPFYMHVGDEDIAPAVPGLCDYCGHLDVCCTAIFCPCVVFASTRANNIHKAEGKGVEKDVWAHVCSGACWAFGIAQISIPCCRPLIYALCIKDEEKQCACNDCCEWWCCFSCKATQRFRVSAIPPAPLNPHPFAPEVPPAAEMFSAKHRVRRPKKY